MQRNCSSVPCDHIMSYEGYRIGKNHCSIYTLKHPGQRDPEKGPLGPNSIPGERWLGNQSTWREIWPRAESIWPHYLSIYLISGSSLTLNGVWPQWTLFRVTADPGVFRVYKKVIPIKIFQKFYDWRADKNFGYQRLTGCNPAHIRLCTEIPERWIFSHHSTVFFIQTECLMN